MTDVDELSAFRDDLPDAPSETTSRARQALEVAVEQERSSLEAGTSNSRRPRYRVAAAATGVFALAAVVSAVISGQDSGSSSGTSPPVSSLSAELKSYSHLDVDPLSSLGLTLSDLAGSDRLDEDLRADITGTGTLVDVRLAYSEPLPSRDDEPADELQHMFLVVQPERLTTGSGLVGESGEVLIDVAAPPLNTETGDRGIDELRESLSHTDPVFFALAVKPPPVAGSLDEEFAGRAEDDPLLWPSHPSSLLIADEESGVATPLLTSENLEEVSGNLSFARDLGLQVDRFESGSGKH